MAYNLSSFLSQNWCQISARFFFVLPGTENLKCRDIFSFYSIKQTVHTQIGKSSYRYRKVASSIMACLEAHARFFRLLMKEIFDPYVP